MKMSNQLTDLIVFCFFFTLAKNNLTFVTQRYNTFSVLQQEKPSVLFKYSNECKKNNMDKSHYIKGGGTAAC